MKRNYSTIVLGSLAALIIAISSCTSTGSMKCPDVASRKTSHPHFFAKAHPAKHSKAGKTVAAKEEAKPTERKTSPIIAFLKNETPMNATLPSKYELSEEQITKANEAFGQYSNNKVTLTKNDKGKVVLHADSRKDFVKLTKTLIKEAKKPAMSDEARDILALVGGILGIVSIASSVIPYWNFFGGLVAGIAAIVLGALGLKSERRHKWALLGIILGSVGVFLSIGFIILYYYILFHAAWI